MTPYEYGKAAYRQGITSLPKDRAFIRSLGPDVKENTQAGIAWYKGNLDAKEGRGK